MAKQTGTQKEIVERVMHEFKHGELEQSQGGKVRTPKQAIAIALSEAGESNRRSPQENRRRLAKTKQNAKSEQAGQVRQNDLNRAELYKEATRKGISGRSRMSKADLHQALQKAR